MSKKPQVQLKLANFALLVTAGNSLSNSNSNPGTLIFFFCMGSETESVHFLPFKPCHWQYAASFVHAEPLSFQEMGSK